MQPESTESPKKSWRNDWRGALVLVIGLFVVGPLLLAIPAVLKAWYWTLPLVQQDLFDNISAGGFLVLVIVIISAICLWARG